MITIAVLRSWRPDRLGRIADDVVGHRRALVRLQDELDAGTPPADWSGDDAAAARTTHDSLVSSLVDEVAGLSVVVDALETAQAEVGAAQDDLEGAISFARGQGLEVDVASGRVTSPPSTEQQGFLGDVVTQAMVDGAALAIQQALQRGADADTALVEQLGLADAGVDSTATDLAGGVALPSLPAPTVGPPGSVETYALKVEGGVGVQGGTYMLLRVEHLADGTVRVTKVLSDGVGYEAGAGIDVSLVSQDRRYGFTTIASAGAMLTQGDGEVYEIDADEFDDFLPALLLDAGASKAGDLFAHTIPGGQFTGIGSVVPGVVGAANDLLGGYDLPEPVATVEQIGLEGEADAAWGLIAGGASADVGSGGTGSLVSHEDGTKSLVLDVKNEGSVRAYAGYGGEALANASAEGQVGYRVTIDVGSDGTPEQARLDMTYGGQHEAFRGGDPGDDPRDAEDNFYREQSVTVPLDDDTRAALARLTREGDVDGFLASAGDGATVTRRDYDLDTGATGANFEGGGILFKAGLGGEVSTEAATTRDAEYWDGTRWRQWE